jgi:hypothetical protein
VTQRSLLVRNFNRARLCDGSALSRGRSAEPEEPDGGRVLDSNIKRVAEPEREEPDDDGRYYARRTNLTAGRTCMRRVPIRCCKR